MSKDGDKMPRNFKTARLMKKIKLKDAAEKLGVSQPTVSSWESGRKSPPIEQIIAMSKLYGVSSDFLLGLVGENLEISDKKVPTENYLVMHGQPVWSDKYGWLIVDSINSVFLSDSDTIIPFEEVQDLYYMAPQYTEALSPITKPIGYDDIRTYSKVWVEPILKDIDARNELRGWYTIKKHYVENEFGNKFYFDTYGSKWVCYENNMED